jgi:Na+-translocating ferredoxin:NAD+ oxidoreductase RnfD subunit
MIDTKGKPGSRPAATSSPFKSVSRFFKSPKGILLLALGVLTGVALTGVNPAHALPMLASAMFVAALTDLGLMAMVKGDLSFPSGALLTGLLVALVLSSDVSPFVSGLTSALAIGSKYVFRTRWSNVFNPAALALVVSYFVFGTGESWWGALPTLPVYAVLLVLAVGVFMADRVNKLPMALAFLGAFFGLFALTSFIGDPSVTQEVFRSPDANAALFLALFMLDDPPTSPVKYPDQILYGVLAAVISYSIFVLVGAVYYLPAGILVANAWESLRRIDERATDKPRVAQSVRQPSQP